MRSLSFSAVLVSAAALAQSPPALNARAAQAIIAGCVAQSTPRKQSHASVVVDTGGHVIAALLMDGNNSGIYDFAVAKAEAAAAWGFSTAQMAKSAIETPGFSSAPHVVPVPGGVPVWSADGKVRIGAVGVSGEAPPDDAACAEAGVIAAGLRAGHS
jgi:glc operon protein GlcG